MMIDCGIPGYKRGTNINEITVPDKLRERRLTGLSWYDDAMGGEGLVPSTVHMLSGTPGAGKSTLVRQLADSITKQGHIAIYNSGEESLYQVKMACERMQLKTGFIANQDRLVPELLEFADAVMEANPTKQVFVLQDSLQTADDGFYKNGVTNSASAVRVTEQFTSWAKQSYAIVMFISQCTKGGDFAGKQTILHAVDARGHLFFDDDRRSETWGERLFEVEKNRFGTSGATFIISMEKDGLHEKGRYNRQSDWKAGTSK